MVTNSVGSIALRQVKNQTCQAHNLKPNYPGYVISSRELIPIEQSRAENDQRCPDHTLLWMRRWANTVLIGITLRQYRDLLYESCAAGGKPSTRLAPGELVEQHYARWRNNVFSVHWIMCSNRNYKKHFVFITSWKCLGKLAVHFGCLKLATSGKPSTRLSLGCL